jgi:hypothetical protein
VLPYQIIEFDAAFDEPAVGRGFKYAVRGWATQKEGDYTKHFKPVPVDDKKAFLEMIDNTAIAVQREIKEEFARQMEHANKPGDKQ